MHRLTRPLAAAFVLVAASTAALAGDGDVRVIVGFKGSADADAVRRAGGAVVEVHGGLKAVVATVPPARLGALRANAGVAYVEEDAVVTAIGKPAGGTVAQPAQSTPWGITRVRSAETTQTGTGVKVAVIDTGIDLDHPDLAANVAGGATFVSRTTTPDDDNGHGSHVAGTIAALDNAIGVVGVAPTASLYAVKVLDKRGSGLLSSVAAGIDWARTNGMHVANMSLGSSSSSTTLANACAAAETAGVLLVAAAGNSGDGDASTSEASYPAAYPSVVSVGATNSSDGVASFSNTHATVELSAPGVAVLSTTKGASYATWNGTSMASPHAAGVAALVWADRIAAGTASRAAVRTALETTASDQGPTGRDAAYGFGIVQYVAP
jgi:subtilisin family serine protease